MNDEGEIMRVSLTPAAAPLIFHSNVCGSLDLLKGLGNHVGGRADALPIPAIELTTQCAVLHVIRVGVLSRHDHNRVIVMHPQRKPLKSGKLNYRARTKSKMAAALGR